MEAEPKLIFGYLSLISDTKSNHSLVFDQLISIFFNPNFTKLSNSSKNEFLIEVLSKYYLQVLSVKKKILLAVKQKRNPP